MEKKEVYATEYFAEGCDDIGILFTITYVCPHCNNSVSYSGLEGYQAEYDDSVYYGTYAVCPECKKSCFVHKFRKVN